MTTVPASIPVLRWAAGRARLDEAALMRRFRKWPAWLAGAAQPTLRQLETFARLTHTPIGYFFLPEPPGIALPVPDFRTTRDRTLTEPSSALLDTLYLCQQRQEWYRDHARLHGMAPLVYVGNARVEEAQLPTWTDALRQLIAQAEEAGILVMASGIVGSNSHRPLEVDEFRGFALADALAPLVFLNAADSKAAQMFTLAHELAHLWLGVSGVSDPEAGQVPERDIERWCNRVAAELLMPLRFVAEAYHAGEPIPQQIQRLARDFKVSTLVALRRLFDAGLMGEAALWQHYRDELARIRALDRGGSGGGDFYRTLGARTGKRFARAVLASTLEGQTLFQDAFRLLGMRKTATFYEAARELGVMA